MLSIPLSVLEREGSLEIQAAIPPDDACWEGTELRFSTPLSVTGRAHSVPSGEVLVRVRVEGGLALECRRCLEPVEVGVGEDLTLLYAPVDEMEEMEEDESARPLPTGPVDLDLAEGIREEVILSLSPFALCKPDCEGLCPQCGVNLNDERCQCTVEEVDPRWEALRTLKEERE